MKKKQKKEFSKWLLAQESALIWIMTISFIVLAFYYKKSEKENTKNGITFESAMRDKVKTEIEDKSSDIEFDETAVG